MKCTYFTKLTGWRQLNTMNSSLLQLFWLVSSLEIQVAIKIENALKDLNVTMFQSEIIRQCMGNYLT